MRAMNGVVMAMLAITGCRSGGTEAAGPPTPAPTGAVEGVRDGETLVGPFTHANLSIYLVVNGSIRDDREFLTLDEGLHAGLVTINERGGSEGSDEGTVNTLEVSNKSGKWLYIEAGEIVRGGKQDRTMGTDLLVAPNTKDQPLAAFCVEHGRWTRTSGAALASFAADEATVERLGQIAETAGGVAYADGTNASGASVDVKAAEAGMAFTGAVAALPASAKIAVLKEKGQQQVWDAVARARAENAADTSGSGTFMDVVTDKQVRERVAPYIAELLPCVKGQAGVIGAVFARDGHVVAADCYGAPGLFLRLFPKLLESHARDAALSLEADAAVPAPPAADAVTAFLRAAEDGAVSTEATAATQQLRTCENAKTIAFEALADGKRLHYNALKK